MILVANRIPVNPDHADAFEQRFKDRAHLVEGMEGFISFQLLRPHDAEDPYVVLTYWETHEHFKAWTNSDEFKQGHAQSGTLPENTFRGHPKLEIHEVIQTTRSIEEIGE